VSVEFLLLDVFADKPFEGNQLAVFLDAGELTSDQMQTIASEMNLSETTFVRSADDDSYQVRIFTPTEEMPFAGHPTIGTAWALRHAGLLSAEKFVQHSKAGETRVRVDGDLVWFERSGHASDDLEDTEPDSIGRAAEGLGLDAAVIGLEARELGRSGRLRPAFADAGALDQLIVPLRSIDSLVACRPRAETLQSLAPAGVYCFTAYQAGRVRARGFFPGLGVDEDPATGSAAAALGLYLARRVGDISLEVLQGIEMGRPSRIRLRAERGTARVGGRALVVGRGKLEALP
jgi:trans-2,3-dihydro-3-hydroxyanthranilate isomerase